MSKTLGFRILRFCAGMCGIILFVGCSSFGWTASPSIDKEIVQKESFGSPENTTLIFGYVGRQELGFKMGFHELEFIQVNPKFEPMWMNAGVNGKVFYLAPLPTGASAHLVYYKFAAGSYIYETELSFRKGQDITIDTTSPGLLFAGSWVLDHGPNDGLLPGSKYAFLPDTYGKEKNALNALLKQLSGTSWEPLVLARLEELENEK